MSDVWSRIVNRHSRPRSPTDDKAEAFSSQRYLIEPGYPYNLLKYCIFNYAFL